VRKPLPKLHAVTDPEVAARSDLSERARALARPGIALHARARHLTGRSLSELTELLKAAAGYPTVERACVFVNDRVDVGLSSAVDGVHLPADGLSVPLVRRLVGQDMWIGRSVHSPEEARAAASEGADYVFLGPIWETASHPDRLALGPSAITHAQPARVIAIGGITHDRIRDCLNAGAYGVAAISALWGADHPGSAAQRMLLLLGEAAP
jgi:thiamine-phosphate pyrophosphorylase